MAEVPKRDLVAHVVTGIRGSFKVVIWGRYASDIKAEAEKRLAQAGLVKKDIGALRYRKLDIAIADGYLPSEYVEDRSMAPTLPCADAVSAAAADYVAYKNSGAASSAATVAAEIVAPAASISEPTAIVVGATVVSQRARCADTLADVSSDDGQDSSATVIEISSSDDADAALPAANVPTRMPYPVSLTHWEDDGAWKIYSELRRKRRRR